ncbi:hypothetical protein DT73_08445 [Mangrovibacter sp. MFB070]|uniref:winged helix-turn-helix domain-containing protein n=1 Tax=Mangrovibacter sp. MFB070 TaxID=1224318 RepID=UPI0004D84E73|nr:winged helix-turn-helix domain-containing protein [Mangrovibacter sp. MFB070]KEA53378.1 hypothetical protein DT73_08445 [Mangrovibacter sp. MFB070]
MKYVIAGSIIYDTESGTLAVKETGSLAGSPVLEEKKLTHTANRILSLLIASPGQVLERSYLLETVWESAGHVSSSSSLNQYVSILRKILTSLTDIEETIIAVPRVGFYFSADIEILPWHDISQPDTQQPVEVQRNAAAKLKLPWRIVIPAALITLLVLANIAIRLDDDTGARFTRLYNAGTIGKCQLQTFEQLPGSLQQKLLNMMSHFQPDMAARCEKQPFAVTVQVQRSVFYGGRGRVFYSLCPLDDASEKVIYCENHYTFDGEWK